MKTQDNDIGRLNARLEEAAMLLARVKTGDQQLASDIDQWFFRTAPQPEPTQASAEAGAKYFDWDRAPAQPAAPAAEQAFEDGLDGSDWTKPPKPAAPALCHPTDPCRHGITGPCSRCQPDAPEPSGEYHAQGNPSAEVMRAIQEEYPGSYQQQAMNLRAALDGERAAYDAALEWQISQVDELRLRAESAEAQLAAIGEWTHRKGKALVPHGGWSDSFGDGMRNAHAQVSALLAPGRSLLTAPSPGEGEETL